MMQRVPATFTSRTALSGACHSEEEQPDFRAYVFSTAGESGAVATTRGQRAGTTRDLGAGTAAASIRFGGLSQRGMTP